MRFTSFLRNFFEYFFPVGIRGRNRKGFVPNLTIKEKTEAKGFFCVATQYHCSKLAVGWKLLQSRGSQMKCPTLFACGSWVSWFLLLWSELFKALFYMDKQKLATAYGQTWKPLGVETSQDFKNEHRLLFNWKNIYFKRVAHGNTFVMAIIMSCWKFLSTEKLFSWRFLLPFRLLSISMLLLAVFKHH